jgi:hypothetical protein
MIMKTIERPACGPEPHVRRNSSSASPSQAHCWHRARAGWPAPWCVRPPHRLRAPPSSRTHPASAKRLAAALSSRQSAARPCRCGLSSLAAVRAPRTDALISRRRRARQRSAAAALAAALAVVRRLEAVRGAEHARAVRAVVPPSRPQPGAVPRGWRSRKYHSAPCERDGSACGCGLCPPHWTTHRDPGRLQPGHWASGHTT